MGANSYIPHPISRELAIWDPAILPGPILMGLNPRQPHGAPPEQDQSFLEQLQLASNSHHDCELVPSGRLPSRGDCSVRRDSVTMKAQVLRAVEIAGTLISLGAYLRQLRQVQRTRKEGIRLTVTRHRVATRHQAIHNRDIRAPQGITASSRNTRFRYS